MDVHFHPLLCPVRLTKRPELHHFRSLSTKRFYWFVVFLCNYLRGVQLWILLMDHGQAVGLFVPMTTWLCDYSSRISSRQRAAAIVAKCNGAIMEFACKILVDTFSIDFFPHTYRLISISHTALISIYSSSFIYLTCTELITLHIFLYMLGLTQCRCQSRVSSWFSISQPSCRRLWRRKMGLPQVTVRCVPIQKHPTAIPPTRPWECTNAFPPPQQQHVLAPA